MITVNCVSVDNGTTERLNPWQISHTCGRITKINTCLMKLSFIKDAIAVEKSNKKTDQNIQTNEIYLIGLCYYIFAKSLRD